MKQASLSVCGNTPEVTVREWLGISRRLEFRRDLRVYGHSWKGKWLQEHEAFQSGHRFYFRLQKSTEAVIYRK